MIGLERHRQQLEANVTKLSASLRHWQTWEAEYEGMKEELYSLGEDHTGSDLVSIIFPKSCCFFRSCSTRL